MALLTNWADLSISIRYTCLPDCAVGCVLFLTTVQNIGAIVSELEKDGTASFYFLDGLVEQPASKEVDGLYEGPYYGYFRCDYSMSENAPDSFHEAWKTGTFQDSVAEAYNLIYDVLEEEGPFGGIIGFSHGATLAFAFLLHHAEKNPLDPPFALFRCAVFISGPAPLGENGMRLSFDEVVGALLKIPTVHVAGKADALFEESLNLYRLCEKYTAKLVCHDKGHWVPRDRANTLGMVKAIRDLIDRSTLM